MNDQSQSASASPTSNTNQAVRIYGVVLGVGVACSLAIVSVHELTGPIIQRNKVAMRQRAILDVLPAAVTSAAFQLDESGSLQSVSADAGGEDLLFAGFNEQDDLVGLAIETKGMGYQDYIRVLYGYSFDADAIIGIRVLESRETPGLGDRIETDEDFLRNFDQLDVSLNADGTELAHPIKFVKPGQKSAPWQIDGISGATISSRAIAEMLRDSAALWIPRVRPRRTDFQVAESRD